MANNYLNFSEIIDDLTPEERKWWQSELEIPEFSSDEAGDLEEEKWCESHCIEDISEWPGCEYRIEKNSVWFYAEEGGDVEKIADMMQRFLEAFRPNSYFHLSWAETCSKPRLGEFGGGAVFVTATSQQWTSTYDFIGDCIKANKEKNNVVV